MYAVVFAGVLQPPVAVQVEAGPQEGTLLVTWMPVTITKGETYNGSPVTGYAVYGDKKKLKDIPSPAGKVTI